MEMRKVKVLSATTPKQRFPIPKTYKFVKVLGQGSFGTVIKCVKRKTGKCVAVKINRHNWYSQNWEAIVMTTLMGKKMENFNIVKYEGIIFSRWRFSLAYEILDFSLQDYLNDIKKPMQLHSIRIVIKQIAEAFVALQQKVGVIHTDVKTDNIMLVNHARDPFRVKLIDFGLAIFRWQTKLRSVNQAPSIAAPEVILGLPISEAIDVWSLGCTMATMLIGVKLFPGRLYKEVLRHMIALLGEPPTCLLSDGTKTKLSFEETESGSWKLMRASGHNLKQKTHKFQNLDEMKLERLEIDNPMEADERSLCIDLLKEMLQWDDDERITASDILNHPFITKEYLKDAPQCEESIEPVLITSLDEDFHFKQNLEESSKHPFLIETKNGSQENPDKIAYCITNAGSILKKTQEQLETLVQLKSSAAVWPKGSNNDKEKKEGNKNIFLSWIGKKLPCNCCKADSTMQ